jgi:hypothetical protein
VTSLGKGYSGCFITPPNPAFKRDCRKSARPPSSTTRASPNLQLAHRDFFSSLPFPRLIAIALPGLCKKVKDCETTNGHVGRMARTLMKDARRDLNR